MAGLWDGFEGYATVDEAQRDEGIRSGYVSTSSQPRALIVASQISRCSGSEVLSTCRSVETRA